MPSHPMRINKPIRNTPASRNPARTARGVSFAAPAAQQRARSDPFFGTDAIAREWTRTLGRKHLYRATACALPLAALLCASAGAATYLEIEPSACGESRSVPRPFDPLAVARATGPVAELIVRPWGREYVFNNGPVPGQIISQGAALFEEPPVFRIRDSSDQAVNLVWTAPELISADESIVCVETTAETTGTRISAVTRIEYDGMIDVSLQIEGKEATEQLNSFEYEFNIRQGVAEFFDRHVPYDFSNLNIDKKQLLESAGRLPDEMAIDFAPSLYIGNREVGLEWWSESNVDWRGDAAPIVLRRAAMKSEPTSLRITPIQEGGRISLKNAWNHRFAVFPFPTRPLREGWRTQRFISYQSANRFDRSGGQTYWWIAFPHQFEARWHGLPESLRNEKQNALRKKLVDLGVHYVPYAKLTAAPSMNPVAMGRWKSWSANGKWFTFPPGDERKLLERSGKWKEKEPYSYAVCMGRVDYLNWMLNQIIETIIVEGTDGIYFDHGAISRMCESSPALANKKRSQIWEYFNVRSFYKSLFERLAQLDRPVLVLIHTNGQPRALGTFVDFVFTGEALSVKFGNARRWPEIQENPGLYRPDYLDLPEGFLEAQILPPVGGVTSLLPMLKWARDTRRPGRLRRYQREFLAYALANDVHFWFANSDQNELARVMAAVDQFGEMTSARFLPWWSAPPERKSALRTSIYLGKSSALIVFANLGDTRETVRFSLAGREFDVRRPVKLVDPEAKQTWVLDKDSAMFSVEVPARDFRLRIMEGVTHR